MKRVKQVLGYGTVFLIVKLVENTKSLSSTKHYSVLFNILTNFNENMVLVK